MTTLDASEPDEIESLKRFLFTERAARLAAEAKADLATGQVSEQKAGHPTNLAFYQMLRSPYSPTEP